MSEENIEKRVDESWKETAKQEAKEQPQEKEGQDIPPVDFASFITSISLQALIFMGDIPNPISNKKEENLPQARFLIDTLLMLKEKTQGNLSAEEAKALENFVYELQMRFVEKQKKS
jgi:hypothetical protein